MAADVRMFDDAEVLGEALADVVLARGGGRFLLGCPGGRSLRATYAALAHPASDSTGSSW